MLAKAILRTRPPASFSASSAFSLRTAHPRYLSLSKTRSADGDGKKEGGLLSRWLGPTSATLEAAPSSPGFRWAMLAPAFAAHVCLGAPYGWSAISGSLSRHLGFVAPAAGDWGLDLCSYPMSIIVSTFWKMSVMSH